MSKLSKRVKKIKHNVNLKKIHDINEAITLLQKSSNVKFIESVDIAVNLGINSKKSDQNVRGSSLLPHGIGRHIKVAVFTQGDNIKLAEQAGAEFVGMENLSEKIKQEGVQFDVVIATPDAMKEVTKIGHILGPRGLMPNNKSGTVTQNIFEAVKHAKTGLVRYRNDKNGIIHARIGRINFTIDKIKNNLSVFLESLIKSKPPQSKGLYIKKIVLSTTMGMGLIIDQATLSV